MLAGLALTGLVLIAVIWANTAASTSYTFGALQDRDRMLSLAGSSSLLLGRLGLLEIDTRDASINIILEPEEWDRMLAIWEKARTLRSPHWTRIGAISETDANNARLFLLAGPAIRLVLREGEDCTSFDVEPAHEKELDAQFSAVRQFLHGTMPQQAHKFEFDVDFKTMREALTHWPPAPPDSADCAVKNGRPVFPAPRR